MSLGGILLPTTLAQTLNLTAHLGRQVLLSHFKEEERGSERLSDLPRSHSQEVAKPGLLQRPLWTPPTERTVPGTGSATLV